MSKFVCFKDSGGRGTVVIPVDKISSIDEDLEGTVYIWPNDRVCECYGTRSLAEILSLIKEAQKDGVERHFICLKAYGIDEGCDNVAPDAVITHCVPIEDIKFVAEENGCTYVELCADENRGSSGQTIKTSLSAEEVYNLIKEAQKEG